MGRHFSQWHERSSRRPQTPAELAAIVRANRSFHPIGQLHYGDYGLESACTVLEEAIAKKERIALYADYDVDGTMSCVCWVWFCVYMCVCGLRGWWCLSQHH